MQKPPRGRPRKLLPVDSRLPKAAPEPWPGVRAGGEALPEFFQRVWSPYLAFGLVAAHIRRLDEPLWKALHQHVVTYELPWPAHLAIPGLRPKKPDIAAELDQSRWRELQRVVAAMMRRRSDADVFGLTLAWTGGRVSEILALRREERGGSALTRRAWPDSVSHVSASQ